MCFVRKIEALGRAKSEAPHRTCSGAGEGDWGKGIFTRFIKFYSFSANSFSSSGITF